MAEQKDRRELENKRFRIDTTVNIAHILTTIGLVTAIFTWGSDVKAMLVKHETEITSLQNANGYNDQKMQMQISELRTDVRTLSSKIDYMLDYRPLARIKPK
ncbi:MAG: hypothetical protein HQK87_06925 [Nitrospinae bacterium]|nr:hypothetical protein [Nitrospinota bacterium]